MIYYNHIVIVLLFCGKFIDVIKAENTNIKTENADQRNGKVFSLFSIVTFPNSGCASQSTQGSKARNGTCFTTTECSDKGGTVSGNCAAGFGVCCLFITQTSGTSITQNCSYIQNPNFPNAYGSEAAATYTINKCSTDVCSLRLDFETFSTAGPTTTSDVDASIDSLTITTTPAQSLGLPVIGGINTGYHAYLDVGHEAGATATLSFAFGTSALPRTWEIKVTQLECSNRSKPPPGCMQYFTQPSGRVESYNFQNTQHQHLHNQDYNICIRDSGYKCVEYRACSDANSFGVGGNGAKASIGSECTTDFVGIEGGGACNAAGNDDLVLGKFCGEIFSWLDAHTAALGLTTVCDCTKPFNIRFFSNAAGQEIAAATTAQRGFCLEYKLTNTPN